MEEDNILIQKQTDIDYIVQKALNAAMTSAAAEASKLAKEAVVKSQEALLNPPTPKVEEKKEVFLLPTRLTDGYIENKKLTMDIGSSTNTSRMQPSAFNMFHNVDNPFGMPSIFPPFYVLLYKKTNGTYYAKIIFGLVVELNRSKQEGSDPVILWTPLNWDAEFTPSLGDALYVKVEEDGNGSITLVEVIKDENGKESSNYGGPYGGGTYYYKLAFFDNGPNGDLRASRLCSGSHIFHQTGLSEDIRFMSCQYYDNSDPPVPLNDPTQLGRLTFISGVLSGVNLTPEELDVSGATIIEVRSCNSWDEYSMP